MSPRPPKSCELIIRALKGHGDRVGYGPPACVERARFAAMDPRTIPMGGATKPRAQLPQQVSRSIVLQR